jgi:hypothetical protein
MNVAIEIRNLTADEVDEVVGGGNNGTTATQGSSVNNVAISQCSASNPAIISQDGRSAASLLLFSRNTG